MSFTLAFFKQKDAEIALDDVITFFHNEPNFFVKPLDDDLLQFVYHNPLTNVLFSITYNERQELNVEIPEDIEWEYCYTTFTLSYLRPTYYAKESLDIVVKFMKYFNLAIYNPQTEPFEVKKYTFEELVDSYIQNNSLTAREFNKQFPVLTISKNKVDYFYDYTIKCEMLELPEDVALPDISFIKDKNNIVYTVFAWPQNVKTIMPITDYVLIERTYKKALFLKKTEVSLVPFSEIQTKFKDYLVKLDDPIPCFLFETDNETTKQLYYELSQQDFTEYEVVETDDFVDVEF